MTGQQLNDRWHGKPYYSLDAYCKNHFHHKCHKIALDAHMTCPNRDGTLDTRGCIFCSAGGSGDFAVKMEDFPPKTPPAPGAPDLIAYFQAYTNTYAPLPYLEQVYRKALDFPAVRGISIATRPDCLPDDVLRLLTDLRTDYPEKFIWIELGLQTVHDDTARFIRRGYPLSCFEDAFHRLKALEFPVIVHLILGLPGESAELTLESAEHVNRLHPFGVKLQLLHILANTDLADIYRKNPFFVMEKEQYLTLITDCLGRLSPDIVIHRLTGDGPKKDLIAPRWSANKRDVLNSLHQMMRERNRIQGDCLKL